MKKQNEFATENELNNQDLATLRAERSKKLDAKLIKYQELMAGAPKLLADELRHLESVEPEVKAIAQRILAKYPEMPALDPPRITRAIRKLRDHCAGALNYLANNIPGIKRHHERITTRTAIIDCAPEVRAEIDWRDVRGLANGGKAFLDFAAQTAELEKEFFLEVKTGLANERQGTGSPLAPSTAAVAAKRKGGDEAASGNIEVRTNLPRDNT